MSVNEAFTHVPLVPEVAEAAQQSARAIQIDYKDYGLLKTSWLWTLFFQARTVTSRVRNHVIARPEEMDQAWVIRDSFATSLGMIAVAASVDPSCRNCQYLSLTVMLGCHCGTDCDHGIVITKPDTNPLDL